jgi:8-oxo-dGTP pyrophosphatase MutT (NUDIX family)
VTLSLDDLKPLQSRKSAQPPPFTPDRRSAAVALIFHRDEAETTLCFARRAPFDGDPWSGDMAFPGGGAHPSDRSFEEVARRETLEEIGFDLGAVAPLATLETLPARGLPPGRHMLIQPLVYTLTQARPKLVIGAEIAAVYWVPTCHLWDAGNLTQVTWRGQHHPGIAFGQEIIWGLTYRILAQLGRRLGKPLPGDPS